MEELISMRERFDKLVEWIGDKIDRGDEDCFDIKSFEKFKDYILNWEVVERCVEDENELGFSCEWDEIEFVEDV